MNITFLFYYVMGIIRKWRRTWTKEKLPRRRILPLRTAIESAKGRDSSLVYITAFLTTKSAITDEEDDVEDGIHHHDFKVNQSEKTKKKNQNFWTYKVLCNGRVMIVEAKTYMWGWEEGERQWPKRRRLRPTRVCEGS